MISFRQYLEEARMAPLYHATPLRNAMSIINNGFEPNTLHSSRKIWLKNHEVHLDVGGKEDYAKGVSLTRSFDFAKYWGQVVFEIDQQKLIQRYKVVPYNYFQSARFGGSRGSEFEEFVVTKKSIPFKYVRKVYFEHMIVDHAQKIIDEITKKYGADKIGYYE